MVERYPRRRARAMTLHTIPAWPVTRAMLAGLGLVLAAESWAAAPPFEAPFFSFHLGDAPVALAVGDVNGDGRADLVSANGRANTVSVLLGLGDGTFAPRLDFATGAGPAAVAMGDLDGDGHPDVVTANSDGNSLTLL